MDDSAGELAITPPLIETKLYVPRWRPGHVQRPMLVERLESAAERKLTLVSAPAGFGKTTLLAEWLATSSNRRAAWVSLDERDNDPMLFWAYVITALQRVVPGVGERALSLLDSSQLPPVEVLLGTLLNDIAITPEHTEDPSNGCTLVLDDYHVIEASSIHAGVAFLLEHLPPQLHLVIASRADPPFAVSRLRARGELTEFRAAHLRFTSEQAATFLNDMMHLDLQAGDIAALEARTEGWIAGLQLAALSMQGRADAAGFIADFAGNHRYIVDYLVDEVLQRQPDHVQLFLLQTSMLDRLSGPLCDAVTGQADVREMLEALERGNLFVVPLDDQRRWYRYHHLFADVLQAHATAEIPEHLPTLHQRASEWYEQNGLAADAIRHALAAGDSDRAARLVEVTWRVMDRGRRSATWLGWAKALADDAIRARPVLSAGYAWALLDAGELEAGAIRLQDAERWLENQAAAGEPVTEATVADQDEFRFLPATIANARAYHAQALGDVASTMRYARQALDLLPAGEHVRRGSPAALLAMASWANGDLPAAERALVETAASVRAAGNVQFTVTGAYVLASLQAAQGRLSDAVSTLQESLALVAGQSGATARGAADLHTGLSEVALERNDLLDARQHLLKSKELGEHSGLPHWPHRYYAAQARLAEAQGDLEDALQLLAEAERHYVRGPVPDARPGTAWRARIWLAQGQLAVAVDWAREAGLSSGDDPTYLREFEHLTLARVLIACCRSERDVHISRETARLLERLLQAAESGGRVGSVLEIFVLDALNREAAGDLPGALASLERALVLGEREGHARVFVDGGAPMRALLRHAASAGTAGAAHARRLLPALEAEAVPPAALGPEADSVIEPLTAREIEIVRLVAAGMRNQEIADHLVISLATVKRHIANAYGKLGVGHRTEAVARANELELL